MSQFITFLDKDGDSTDIDHAISFVATEYDELGNTGFEVFGRIV